MTVNRQKPKMLDTTKSLGSIAKERVQELRNRIATPNKYVPVPTPLRDLNRIINNGLPRNDPFYLVILGMDKLGKSTLLKYLFMAYLYETGRKGIIYDLEENLKQAADRALTMRSARVSRTDIYTLNLTEDDLNYLDDIADDICNEEIFANDRIFTLDPMVEDALARGCTDIAIDNYQLLVGGIGGNSREMLEHNSKQIMRNRNELGLSTWLAAQGNEREKTFGSTQPFRDGDIVLEMDYIRDYSGGKKKGDPLQGVRCVRVKRCRFAGTGEIDVVFDPAFSRVRDVQLQDIVPTSGNFVEFEEEQPELFNDDEEIINGSTSTNS